MASPKQKNDKLDWFPLYAYEFMTDVTGWSNQELGAYFRLLCHQWINGKLPQDRQRLARIVGEPFDVFESLWKHIGSKFVFGDNTIFNEKLEQVRKQQTKKIAVRSESGSAGAEARWRDSKTQFPFSMFWDMYDKKVGEKDKLERKWSKVPEEERAKAIAYIPRYKAAQPEKKYRKNPETFLNNKSWNDELIDGTAVKKINNNYPQQVLNILAKAPRPLTESDKEEIRHTKERHDLLKQRTNPGGEGKINGTIGADIKKEFDRMITPPTPNTEIKKS